MARRASFARLPAPALRALRLAARSSPTKVWLVGGALRDLLLGRPISDLDLACSDARGLARKLARGLRGKAFPLDESNGVYRVVLPAGQAALRQLDVAELQGGGIAADLARRDFTINALALALTPRLDAAVPAASLLDPRGGLKDLAARLLRCESERLFKDDPLRLLRAFRIAAQLGFSLEPRTLKTISRLRRLSLKPAAERTRSELMLLLEAAQASRWLRLLEQAGLLTAIFAELEPERRCAEEYYGLGGVLKHSLDACERADFLLGHIDQVFPEQSRAILRELDSRSPGGQPLRPLLLLTVLLHDVSKPETARLVAGRLRFFGHDAIGARRVQAILRRLRFSNEQAALACAVVANHLRPGQLASGGAVTPKASYRLFRDLGEHALPLLLVCWADHASYLPGERLLKALPAAALDPEAGVRALARLKGADARKTVRHLQVISLLARRLFDEKRRAVPRRLLDGREVMRALNLKPGPAVGEWLERLREAQAEGKVATRAQALAFLKS
ncbi:MAG: CCA tRNA nucleotidyltransferase [Elusimicrobia bacterium]|nr:CCA tRNA nucleotidyltransferase [Elusimicrobiota bacterium]MDE2425904.1 CCA tRNA nucleotidyltransferase [Elusimicrobiota bacterium]